MSDEKIFQDNIYNPAHYTVYPVQQIEISRYLGFCLGNATKYVLRAPYKGGTEDCLKALRYLEIERKKPQAAMTVLSFDLFKSSASKLAEFFFHTDGDFLWHDIAHESACFLAVLIAYCRSPEDFMIMQMGDYVKELKRILALRDTTGQIYEGMTGLPEIHSGSDV